MFYDHITYPKACIYLSTVACQFDQARYFFKKGQYDITQSLLECIELNIGLIEEAIKEKL